MARSPGPLPHDFPDRAICDALLHPRTLRAVVHATAADVAPQLDYDHAEVVKPTYLLDDWRKRNRDVLVRIPFLTKDGRSLLVCVLVEHQSTMDLVMPFRLLLYAVLFWEQEWKSWEEAHERGVELRLTPVLPLVFYTGFEPWDTNRSLDELFDVPEELRGWLPSWRMPLWDLSEHPIEELLHSEDPWWRALAVARASRESALEFRRVLSEVLRSLEGVAATAHVYWSDLLKLVLSWSLYRRPRSEHAGLVDAARSSQEQVQMQEEVAKMSQTLGQTWEEELTEKFQLALAKAQELAEKRGEERGERRGEKRGEERGEERGEKRGEERGIKKGYQHALLWQLQGRFGAIPENVQQRVQSADESWLTQALQRAPSITTPEELLSDPV